MQHTPLHKDPTSIQRELLTESTPRDTRFLTNIATYNNVLCMASLHANWVRRGVVKLQHDFDSSRSHPSFLWCFSARSGLKFLSVYIHDTDFYVQSELRSQNLAGLDSVLFTNLASMLTYTTRMFRALCVCMSWGEATRLVTATEPSFMLTRDLRMSTCVATMGRLAHRSLR